MGRLASFVHADGGPQGHVGAGRWGRGPDCSQHFLWSCNSWGETSEINTSSRVLASFPEPDAQAVAPSTSLCVQAVSDEALGTDQGHQEEMWPGLSRGTASNPDRFGRRSFG